MRAMTGASASWCDLTRVVRAIGTAEVRLGAIMRAMTGASASWCDLRVVRAIGTARCDYARHDGQLVRSDPSCPSHWHGQVRLCVP